MKLRNMFFRMVEKNCIATIEDSKTTEVYLDKKHAEETYNQQKKAYDNQGLKEDLEYDGNLTITHKTAEEFSAEELFNEYRSILDKMVENSGFNFKVSYTWEVIK